MAYHLLLCVPTEYHDRATRTHFVKRAFAADIQLVRGFCEEGDKQEDAHQQKSLLRNLFTLRVFLKRVIEFTGFERTAVSKNELLIGLTHRINRK